MLRKLRVPLIALSVILISVPFKNSGGFISYCIIAALLGVLSFSQRERKLALLGTACFLFIAGHSCRYFEILSLPSIFFAIAYLLILAAAFETIWQRCQRIEMVTVLEATVFVTTGVMIMIYIGNLLLTSSLEGLLSQGTLLACGLVFLGAFLGRSSNIFTRMATISIGLAIALEVFNPQLSNDIYYQAWALPYVPLLYVLGFSKSERHLTTASVSARRKFGPTQQTMFGFLLLVPIATVSLASITGKAPIVKLSAFAIVTVVLILIRFGLLIKLRDWSHSQEVKLRQFSQDIITSTESADLDDLTIATLHKLIDTNGNVGIIEVTSSELLLVRESSRSFFTSSRLRTLHIGDLNEKASEWFDSNITGGSRITIEVPVVDRAVRKDVKTFFVAEIPGMVEADLEEHFRSAAAQYSLALNANALAEQIQEERANNRFNTLSQDSNDMVFLVDYISKRIDFAGSTVERLGYNRDDYLGKPILSYVFEDDVKAAKQFLNGSYKKKSRKTIDIRLCQKDSDARWYAMSIRDLSDSDDLNGLLLNFSDIHDRKLSDLNLRNSEARFRSLVQNSSDVSLLVDDELTVSFVSPNITSVFQLDTQHLTGTNLLSFLKACSQETLQHALRSSKQTNRPVQAEVEIQNSLGSGYKLASVTVAQSELDEKDMFVLTMRDISNTRQLENSLRKQALYDDLTGLLNRNAFVHEVQVAIKDLGFSQAVAVIVLNIRDFKEINDSIGFAAGDRVLALVASRLQSTLRGDDILCRLSADEFAVLSHVKDASKAIHLAQIITDTFEEPFALDDHQNHPLEVSVGVAMASQRNTSPSELVQQALVAMHRSKTGNEDNKPTLFTKEMQQEAVDRFELAADLRRALDQDEFNLVYQPLISLNDNTVHSFEALLRWDHPTRGNISPAVFIPLAESNGMIIEIGRWVLRHACAKLIEWQTTYREFSDTSMAVNLSARQLDIEGELNKLVDIVNNVGVNPNNVTIELTESVMVEDADKIRSQLEHLRAMGISIAIDDFGTGVNGLAHLRDFPFDIIKIDKVYIDQIGQTDEGTKLVKQLVELSKGVGAKKVVAEGIETPDQAEALIQMGCHIGQGFYLARPMAEDKLITWLQARRTGELLGA